MATLHQKLAVAAVLAALGGTVWALYQLYSGGVSRRLLQGSRLMVVLLVVQGALGTVLGIAGGRPADASHFVVGPLTVVCLPAALLIASRRQGRGAAAFIAGGWVLTFALALRATGSGGLRA